MFTSNKIILIGIIIVFIGVIITTIGTLLSSKDSNIKAATGIFIGPIPIFGIFNDKRMFYILLIIAVLIFLFYIFFRKVVM